MFCASTKPLPDAATDFSFRCPVMTFSSFSAPVVPTIEPDDDGLALMRRCDAGEGAGGEGVGTGAGAELTTAPGVAGDELTAGEITGGGELVTAAAVEVGALDVNALDVNALDVNALDVVGVDGALGAGFAVQAAASPIIRAAATASVRRMVPILADTAPARRPIGARAPYRFDPSGRRSVLLGAARSCAPASARPSHPLRC